MARAKPNLEWLAQAQTDLNAAAAFRKLGSTDLKLALVIGDQARLVVFEAFQIASIADAGAADMRDADIVIEMSPKDWNAWLRQRARGKGPSLLSLDLDRNVVRARDPLKRLLLERYNRTLQTFFDQAGVV